MAEPEKEHDTVLVNFQLKLLPFRDYLEDTVVYLLFKGLEHLLVARPSNPVRYLGEYLVENDPLKPPPEPNKEPVCDHCAHSPPPPPPPPPAEPVAEEAAAAPGEVATEDAPPEEE